MRRFLLLIQLVYSKPLIELSYLEKENTNNNDKMNSKENPK